MNAAIHDYLNRNKFFCCYQYLFLYTKSNTKFAVLGKISIVFVFVLFLKTNVDKLRQYKSKIESCIVSCKRPVEYASVSESSVDYRL